MAGNALRLVISISASADSARSVAQCRGSWHRQRRGSRARQTPAQLAPTRQVFGGSKPASGLEFGLDAWSIAVSTRGTPIEAPRIKSTKKTAAQKACVRKRLVQSFLYHMALGKPLRVPPAPIQRSSLQVTRLELLLLPAQSVRDRPSTSLSRRKTSAMEQSAGGPKKVTPHTGLFPSCS
jgi:hypothetical protein